MLRQKLIINIWFVASCWSSLFISCSRCTLTGTKNINVLWSSRKVPDFNHIWNFLAHFRTRVQCQRARNSFQCDRRRSNLTDRHDGRLCARRDYAGTACPWEWRYKAVLYTHCLQVERGTSRRAFILVSTAVRLSNLLCIIIWFVIPVVSL